jgi:hypothetical protein
MDQYEALGNFKVGRQKCAKVGINQDNLVGMSNYQTA